MFGATIAPPPASWEIPATGGGETTCPARGPARGRASSFGWPVGWIGGRAGSGAGSVSGCRRRVVSSGGWSRWCRLAGVVGRGCRPAHRRVPAHGVPPTVQVRAKPALGIGHRGWHLHWTQTTAATATNSARGGDPSPMGAPTAGRHGSWWSPPGLDWLLLLPAPGRLFPPPPGPRGPAEFGVASERCPSPSPAARRATSIVDSPRICLLTLQGE